MRSRAIAIGDRFGAWVVVGDAVREKRGEGRAANYVLRYPCRCDCGTERAVRAFKLLSNSRSCGCLTSTVKSARTRHGHGRRTERSRLYRIWGGMVQRCTNPKHDSFPEYGARGIRVCGEWRDFAAFAEWAASIGYDDAKQLDRIDNDRGYEPSNCRWVSDAENKRNMRQTQLVSAFGEMKCLTDWALDARCSVAPHTIARRLGVLGWTPERAIAEPRATRMHSPRFAGHHGAIQKSS